ncbi:MAG: hypothetical protein HYU29_04895 [Chloroflexi bacterium]|nr:hypothetical protein [Chloroflexota bacterium]
MIPLLLASVLAIICLVVVAGPLWRRQRTETRLPGEEPVDIEAALKAAYQEARTLKLELEVGQIPKGRYEEQLGSIRLRAAALLRRKEGLEESMKQLGDILEKEVRTFRERRRAIKGSVDCPQCGTKLGPGSVEHSCVSDTSAEW